jgi:serine/threonine-protein kinase ULK/ATG1
VAIKSVNTSKLSSKLKDNLLSEVRILQELHHPHIVSLFYFKESHAHAHLVMEYCELGDLSAVIRKRASLGDHEATKDMVRKYPNPHVGGLNEVVVRHFLKQMASGLQWIRKRNFLHRDIKPQNLLLVPSRPWRDAHKTVRQPLMTDENVSESASGIDSLPLLKIADFGFARYLSSIQLADTLCGSPLYMAPEILRYEKYDAKADLWSTGTVLFEMMSGKPPFRATNHVELIARIDKNNDRIKFIEGLAISDGMKSLIKALLKKNPTERISYDNFFNHSAVREDIPNLHPEDRPEEAKPKVAKPDPEAQDEKPLSRQSSSNRIAAQGKSAERRTSDQSLKGKERKYSTGTTPERAARNERKYSAPADPPVLSEIKEALDREKKDADERRRVQEKAIQDVDFEREYVLVEKKAVEVNAFADELDHSPQVRAHQGALVRRTTPATVTYSTTAPQTTSRPWPTSRQPAVHHTRQRSLEKQLLGRSPTSASSAITKAINMATFRVLNLGTSPPGKGVMSPTGYNPFPDFPTAPLTTLLIGDGSKGVDSRDEDQRIVIVAEKLANRADVVSSFAEIKYQQLIPVKPVNVAGTTFGANIPEEPDEDLTVDATVTIAEEALVLYVHALSVLAKVFDITRNWFYRKRTADQDTSARSVPVRITVSVTAKVNTIVQWARSRFNDCLEKSEFVARKLVDAQKRLPSDHPGHPSNHPTNSTSSVTTSIGASADNITLTSGVTAEKLMYDRALEMSRLTAINELTNTDLEGGEVNYWTAIHMLEAILDDNEIDVLGRPIVKRDDDIVNGLESEDRATVQQGMFAVLERS